MRERGLGWLIWLVGGPVGVFVFLVVRDGGLVDWGTDLLPLRLGWVGLAS